MSRPAIIPPGSWPRRMSAGLAAGYCGEPSVEAFMARVGGEYPSPRINEGRRQLWLRDDLDKVILPARQRTCDVHKAPAPFRHSQEALQGLDSVLFQRSEPISPARVHDSE